MNRRIVSLGIAAVLLGGCGSGAASPSAAAPTASGIGTPATATPRPSRTAAASASSEESTMPFALSSPAFAAGATIPRKFSCDGAGVSPPLAWAGVPVGAVELALLVDDPDAGGFVHWVAGGIPATASGLDEGATGSDSIPVEGRNGAGRDGWAGPCPPSGTHHYRFTLYAVSRPLGLHDGLTAAELRDAVKGVTVATAALTGTYTRG